MLRDEFVHIFGDMADVFGKQVKDTRADGYFQRLRWTDAEDFRRACEGAIRTEDYFPSFATLRAYVRSTAGGKENPQPEGCGDCAAGHINVWYDEMQMQPFACSCPAGKWLRHFVAYNSHVYSEWQTGKRILLVDRNADPGAHRQAKETACLTP